MELFKRYRWIMIYSPSVSITSLNQYMDEISGFVEAHHGKVEKINNAGFKKFAYDINNHSSGNYLSAYIKLTHDDNLQQSLQLLQKRVTRMTGFLRQIMLCADHENDYSAQLEQMSGFAMPTTTK